METRPPRPHYIWHGTAPKRVKSIKKEGIKPNWGYVYACFSLEDCFRFFALPNMQFDYETNEMVRNPVIDFIKIDTTKLDWDKAQYSSDHDPVFYGCEAIEYDGTIPPDAIVRVKRYNVEEGFKQLKYDPDKTDFEIRQPMPDDFVKLGN
jgi:hypothetical protein